MMKADERPSKKRRLSGDVEPELIGLSQIDTKTSTEEQEITKTEAGLPDRPKSDDESKDNDMDRESAENDLPAPDETAPMASSVSVTQNGQPMSKNQQKKLRKKQEWEAKREERKVIRKEKLVAKKERKREAKQRQAEEHLDDPVPAQQTKSKQKPVQLPITFMIDCDFDDLMRDNERISLASQITRCYSDNRKSLYRAHLAICSFTGNLRDRFDNILSHYKGWNGVSFVDYDFVEASKEANDWMMDKSEDFKLVGSFAKLVQDQDDDVQEKLKEESEVVYLTSEADETLTELKPYSTYIIGGLVDKNREKGICYKRATQRGVKTARLPIGEFMDMQSRKVLATNHVNEIMLKWLECGDWGEAFMQVIPKRKGGKLKGADGQEEQEGEDEERDVSEADQGMDVVVENADRDVDGGVPVE